MSSVEPGKNRLLMNFGVTSGIFAVLHIIGVCFMFFSLESFESGNSILYYLYYI